MLIGFVAQSIDGALGMDYGVSCNSILLGIGIPSAAASAWVHFAQVFTSLASGISHWKMGNVDWKLAKRLLIPGVIGSMIGAFLLSNMDGDMVKLVITVYLLVMGFVILRKARKSHHATKFNRERRSLPVLATTGGFADAIGGGGWGPIVKSTLLSKGKIARYAIGTGNFVEFFCVFGQCFYLFVFRKRTQFGTCTWADLGRDIRSTFCGLYLQIG